MSDDETFLNRWSRRKAAARAPDAPAMPEPAPAIAPVTSPAAPASTARPQTGDLSFESAPAAATKSRPAPLTEADFGDVDFAALDYQSDYGRFMQADVPDAIRRRALNRLWESDPIFTQVDPFQDYAGDYTDKALAVPMGTLQTAYKIGQGFLSDAEAAVWDKLGKPEVAAQSEPTIAAAPAGAVVTIDTEPADQPEVAALLAASDAYMAALYPAESNHLVGREVLAAANATFLVARRDGRVIGCGAVITAADGHAEIKRMWVAPSARGAGAGRRILSALENAARSRGIAVLQLETGNAQPEALGLYRAAGFVERGPFGAYRPDPLSVFMEKRLVTV